MTLKRWIETTNAIGIVEQYKKGINALLIEQHLTQSERLIQLNKVAITQMKSLVESKAIRKLK